MDYFYNDVKFQFKHKLKFLGKAVYLFGYAIFPNRPVTSLQKGMHKQVEREIYLSSKDLGQIIQTLRI